MSHSQETKRRRKLVEPRTQLALSLFILASVATSVVVQGSIFAWSVERAADELPHDGATLMATLPSSLFWGSLLAFGILVPVTLALGIAITFPIVGPLYRFRQFLVAVAEGGHPEPCRIRPGDRFQELCVLLNRVTEDARAAQGRGPQPIAALEQEERDGEHGAAA